MLCVCVCVCVAYKPYIMGKNSKMSQKRYSKINIQKSLTLMGYFLVPILGKQLLNHSK